MTRDAVLAIMQINKLLNPVRVGGTFYSPVHFSPVFSLLCLVSFYLANMLSPFIPARAQVPDVAEWGLLSVTFVGLSFVAGLLPPFLVSVEKYRGYPSVYGVLLLLSLVPVAGLWLNPGVNISFVSAFMQSAGAIAVVLLFSWPLIRHLGTHDSDREERNEWIMHNAVAALLRRGEITQAEAAIVSPLGGSPPDLSTRLQSVGTFTRHSIEREMTIEELVQANKRRFGFRG